MTQSFVSTSQISTNLISSERLICSDMSKKDTLLTRMVERVFLQEGTYLPETAQRVGLRVIRGGGFDPASKNRHWAIPRYFERFMDDAYLKLSPTEKLEALYQAGLVEIKPGNAWPIMVRYLDERSGVPLGDIWAYQPYTEGTVWETNEGIGEEVKWLGPTSPERTDWKTQKPLGLYSRMIKASTDPGDLVLDPFCGCATTCVAAEKLNRRWIGIDIDPVAEDVTKDRLAQETGLFGEKDGYIETRIAVTVKTNPPKRSDIPRISDATLRNTLWQNQGPPMR